MPAEPFLIGLTGGIGCGKTTVACLFAERGVDLVDADALAHSLTAPGGAAIEAIRASFGDAVIDARGAMDRALMRQRVFASEPERLRLEAILHPMIRQATQDAIAATRSPYVLLVIPLLFESGRWRERVRRALVIDCSEEDQITRVMQRSGLTRDEILAIMARQVSRSERLKLADDVIDNSGGPQDLSPAVDRLHQRYLDLAQRSAG